MKNCVFYFLLIIFVSCRSSQKENANVAIQSTKKIVLRKSENNFIIDSLKCGLNFKKGTSYQATKNNVIVLRNSLKNRYLSLKDEQQKDKFLDSVAYIFSETLLNKIVPYWYGTAYDFSGYTSVPNKGTTGCSFFVSTTLKNMGLNVNRYKLAQQNPENEALSLAINKKNEIIIYDSGINKMKDMLASLNEGLYFVGLDCHVGYLYKHDNIAYFIHSNYLEGKVMIELAQSSQAFGSSVYYISKISSNKDLALKWIMNENIKVHSNYY